MTEDRSLDEFAGGGDDAGTDDDAVDGEDGADAGDAAAGTGADTGNDAADAVDPETVDPETVDPATSTSTWTSGGAACADCGTVVERRWNADGDLVCRDCKSW